MPNYITNKLEFKGNEEEQEGEKKIRELQNRKEII
jgi:hypothetical protein